MKPENENGFLKRISIRYMIFVYFTVTALAASILSDCHCTAGCQNRCPTRCRRKIRS